MEFCTREWIRTDKDHMKLEGKYNVASISKNAVVEVTGCPEIEAANENKNNDR